MRFRPAPGAPADWTSPGLEPLSPLASAAPKPPAEGTFSIEERPGFYAYRQDFRAETGLEKSRAGLIGALHPGDSASGTHVVQDTEPHGVEVCLEELLTRGREERLVLAGVENIQSELEGIVERAISSRDAPEVLLELPDGERHTLWKMEDPALLAEVTALFAGRDVFLLDGLHGYKALRRYRERHGAAAEGRPIALSALTLLLNALDFNLMLRAAIVLVKDLPGFAINEAALKMHPFFDIKSYPFEGAAGLPRALTEFREDLRMGGFTESLVGASFAGLDQFFLFKLREGVDRANVFLPDVKEPEQEFDSILLRRVILERYLAPTRSQAPLEYSWSFEEAVAAVRSGKARAAFFLNPPHKRRLLNLARAGFRLPPGSLRVEPPPRRGLVMRAL